MNRFRSHITRILVILLVCCGFAFHLAQPVRASHSSDAFAQWLTTMTKSSDSADLHKKLNKLKKSGAHLDKVIEQASRIVIRNNEEFKFSFAASTATKQVYELLLIEWNQFQTGNAMAAVPAQQTLKPYLPFNPDKSGAFASAASLNGTLNIFPFSGDLSPISQIIASVAVVPMSDCIAIGAP